MSEAPTIRAKALGPPSAASEAPSKRRVRADSSAGAAERKGRRPRAIAIAQSLRATVKEPRDNFHFGECDTVRCWGRCGAARRNFTFPADRGVEGVAAPTSIAANKPAWLELWCIGSKETDVIARHSVQA